MPRNATTPLPQPIFSEQDASPDQTRFKTKHPSDTQQYKEIQNLLKRDVVGFSTSRLQRDALYTLESALGSQGSGIVRNIKSAGKSYFSLRGRYRRVERREIRK